MGFAFIACQAKRTEQFRAPVHPNLPAASGTGKNLPLPEELIFNQGNTSPPSTQMTGASSGGGGFVSENSKIVLDRAAKELSNRISSSMPELFAHLPEPWNQAMLSKAIQNIRMMPDKKLKREGKDLMFNYETDKDGPYIEVLQPFFFIYGTVPIKIAENSVETRVMIRDVQLKIAHEVAHHFLGPSEEKAEAFGRKLLRSLDRSMIYCEVQDKGKEPSPTNNQDPQQSSSSKLQKWLVQISTHTAYSIDWDIYMRICLDQVEGKYNDENSLLFSCGGMEMLVNRLPEGWVIDKSQYPKISISKNLDNHEYQERITPEDRKKIERLDIDELSADPIVGQYTSTILGGSETKLPITCTYFFEPLL